MADPARALLTLCLTQVVGWGTLYYSFAVLAPSITRDTGWSAAAVAGAFSLGQLVSAVVGIPVGRLIDRVGPRWVMTAGSAVATLGLLLVAAAPGPGWFLTGWLTAGAAMAAVLYPPAFTTVTRLFVVGRVRALTTLTLVAGLASTVFAPLAAVLVEQGGWRVAYTTLALLLAATTIPAHAWGLRVRWPAPPPSTTGAQAGGPGAVARSREFIALTAALGLGTFVAFTCIFNLVPLLAERGLSTTTAAWALGLGGAGQVLGRLGYGALTRRVRLRTRTVLVLVATAATTALLGILESAVALVLAALLAGVARGVLTLVQATAVSDRWGTAHYGRLTALVSAPVVAGVALAPVAGTTLAGQLDGYAASFLALAALATMGAALALASVPAVTRADPPPQHCTPTIR